MPKLGCGRRRNYSYSYPDYFYARSIHSDLPRRKQYICVVERVREAMLQEPPETRVLRYIHQHLDDSYNSLCMQVARGFHRSEIFLCWYPDGTGGGSYRKYKKHNYV